MTNARPKILIVDDEPPLVHVLSYRLAQEGYQPLIACCGEECIELTRSFRPDLILLDLVLPDVDELTVCRRVRGFSEVSILILTARHAEADRILGLEAGADDYVVKPFGMGELMARIKARRRLPQGEAGALHLSGGEITLDPRNFEWATHGERQTLPRKEFQVIYLLASHPGRAFTREALMQAVWGTETRDTGRSQTSHTVDVHINSLRKRIEKDPSQPQYVLTVRGLGYMFRPE